MPVQRINEAQRIAAVGRAKEYLGGVLGDDVSKFGAGYIPPHTKLGSLSDWQLDKLVEAVLAGWICERAHQLTMERLTTDESEFLATGIIPDPAELGTAAAILPALGDLCARLDLTDKPIGEWDREKVLFFVHSIGELLTEAKTKRDERPGPADLQDDYDTGALTLMAG